MIEYLALNRAPEELTRCLKCGALLLPNDTDIHTTWHSDLGHLAYTIGLLLAACGSGGES